MEFLTNKNHIFVENTIEEGPQYEQLSPTLLRPWKALSLPTTLLIIFVFKFLR